MGKIVGYLKKIGWKRLVVMIIGNVFLGMGVSIFKFAGLGNDPFSGMVMGLSDVVGIQYANFLILINIFIFYLSFFWERNILVQEQ